MPYKKLAFFVEGYTEQYFVENLLNQIFNSKDIAINIKSISGGRKSKISYTEIKTAIVDEHTKYFVLIYNCGSDSNIKSYILDHRESLIKADFKKIIGLRDLYPDFTREEILRLRTGLNYKVPQKDIQIQFVLSIMEVESWFLAETNHFNKIDDKLTLSYLETNFGYDFQTHNTELIDNSAEILDNIYRSVGKRYKKKTESINRTIDSLDYANLYFEVRKRIKSLDELVLSFEEIFE